MVKYIFLKLAFFLAVVCFAQNSEEKIDEIGRIALNSYVSPDISGIPSSAQRYLLNKLNQISSKNGLGSNNLNPRFIFTAQISIIDKEITSTVPSMIALNMDITFYVGDAVEKKVFSSTTISVKGAGKNETKAYITALKRISTKNPDILSVLETGKSKIIEYYNTRCDFILKDAETLTNKREFDKAIYELVKVPEACKDCYYKAMNLSSKVFKKKLEYDCQVNISKAKTEIAKDNYEAAADYLSHYTPDLSCFEEVESIIKKIENHKCEVSLGKARGAWAKMDVNLSAKYLSEISNDSKCASESKALANEISSKLKDDEKRRWALACEKEKRAFELKNSIINTVKEIGVTYSNNRPKTVTYNNFIPSK